MICIISDTHDNHEAIESAMVDIRLINPDLIVHCGDITSPATLQLFAGFPMRIAFGNCDVNHEMLRKVAAGLGCLQIDDAISFEMEGKNIFVSHGFKARLLEDAIQSNKYDYVLYGHSHLAHDKRFGKTRIINPGALHATKQMSFATLDVSADLVQFYRVM